MENLINILTIVGTVVGVILVAVMGFLVMWKKVPQDKAGIVTGMKKRVISGGGGFVIPLLERIDVISLENIIINAEVTGLTSSSVPVRVASLTVLKIKNEEKSILMAMEQFNVGGLEKTIQIISETSKEVLEGKVREIMATLSVEELYKDRDKFSNSVQEVAALDLAGMGLEIKAFTLKDVSDSQGYIQALGKERTAIVKRDADIAEAKAKSERDLAVADAEKVAAVEVAKRQQETAEARAAAEIKIAEAEREKEIKLQENRRKTETQRAVADQAYQIEANKTQQEVVESQLAIEVARERKQIEVVEAMAAVQLRKEEQETNIAEQRAQRTAKELESEVQKKAEAAAAKTKIDAEADLIKRQKEADAKKYEQIASSDAEAAKKERQAQADALTKERQAQADATAKQKIAEADATAKQRIAEAEAAATKAQGLAQAEAEAAIGKAKAEAIRAQGLAEAEVIEQKALAEAKGKKELAEAYKQYGEAAMTQMIVTVLPEITKPIAEAVASAVGQIKDITVIENGGNGGGASKLAGLATSVLTEVPAVVKALTGIDVNKMLQRYTAEPVAVCEKKMICSMTEEEILNSQVSELAQLSSDLIDLLGQLGITEVKGTLRELATDYKPVLKSLLPRISASIEDAEVLQVIEAVNSIID